jgi:hypothetical protein
VGSRTKDKSRYQPCKTTGTKALKAKQISSRPRFNSRVQGPDLSLDKNENMKIPLLFETAFSLDKNENMKVPLWFQTALSLDKNNNMKVPLSFETALSLDKNENVKVPLSFETALSNEKM